MIAFGPEVWDRMVAAVEAVRNRLHRATAALEQVKRTGTIAGLPGHEPIDNAGLLACECDVLVPAALGGVITEENAGQVRARIVVEAANAPITAWADENLRKRGVMVIPDILANAGGVVVSYFEWVQGLNSFFWTEEIVNSRLGKVMRGAYSAVHELSVQHGCDLRTAAYILAVGRVAEATRVRGIYP